SVDATIGHLLRRHAARRPTRLLAGAPGVLDEPFLPALCERKPPKNAQEQREQARLHDSNDVVVLHRGTVLLRRSTARPTSVSQPAGLWCASTRARAGAPGPRV